MAVKAPKEIDVKTNIEEVKKSVALVSSQLNKKFGDGTIFKMGEKNFTVSKIPFGIRQLDRITEGGLPIGRLTQLAGPEKVGKTTAAYKLMAQIQLLYPDTPECLFIDMERTYDEERAKLMGCDISKILVCQPPYAEEAFEIMHAFAPTGIKLIILDSVPTTYPQKVMEGDIGAQDVAPIPRFLNVEIPKLVPKISRNNVSLLFINQVRDKIGMLGWGDPLQLPGGHQLKHASSMILRMQKKEAIKKSDDILGHILRVKVESSKVCTPLKDCAINLISERGFIEDENLEQVKNEVRKVNLKKNKESAETQLALTMASKKMIDYEEDDE